ncbi:MAG: hypothetical protein AAF222_05700 [Pseudomonadota bacterium]
MRAFFLASVLATPALGAGLQCDPGRMNCSPLVACIEESGEYFRGASFGQDAGPLQATSVTGAVCTGTWRRTLMGIGIAEFTCDDGRVGSSVFNWFEPESGTAVGHGSFADGSVARFWAGNNLERYFREIDPLERERMACNPVDMLLS